MMKVELLIEKLEEQNRKSKNNIMLRDMSGNVSREDVELYRNNYRLTRDIIEQLRYRVKVKPRNIIYFESYGASGFCNQCGGGVVHEMECCIFCGQKLDWSGLYDRDKRS